MRKVCVIGGGLAGSEAAWQLAKRGIKVTLFEMRPHLMTPAHQTGYFAELVCSNSLGAEGLDTASGLLKEELRLLGSVILECAYASRVPAGKALAVDRERFSKLVTERISSNSLIEVVREEVKEVPDDGEVIVATGPLTSPSLSEKLRELLGSEYLYFYDAVSPIVTYESLNMERIFKGSRYGVGEDYLNCPMTKEEYEAFWEALVNAERHPLHSFEDPKYFEGCLPIEVIASRGKETLLYGPLKPVGLIDPKSGKEPYAVVQLRRENIEGTLYNLVGFQTNLKWSEQRRVFRMIPGLENAEFVRYGVMHRNIFINSPVLLDRSLRLKKDRRVLFAGQIVGVEGYMESTAMGLVAALSIISDGNIEFPEETMIGSLLRYITTADPCNFQPMNANFGILPSLEFKERDKVKRKIKLSDRAINTLTNWWKCLKY
ncbi:MAG: methylenetetrahydrofolate--tRNA-(uracil(54)-C(5))-methyltransferase (FADH(2)-oxidizing) TrmFO [Synergistetes bacterium]|nr:methylenetetrahydrofolate--tRNA-(uracil(54)-C(5))-methyltransferase (FADH(2)-oxidizing) TrmFO [Synergistota bacterium]MDW8193018.1 methylenetetrahydrofolate--tRNA-(uracil(54)-C(5))-methyltransferase (FADH(2)-oxidizing) TrmFO [Synergistota bacterium]